MQPSFFGRSMAAALAMIWALAGQPFGVSPVWAEYGRVAEPRPPTVDLGMEEASRPATGARLAAAAIEWTYHKTDDHRHPDGQEQQFLWLVNRARSDPAREGRWLATMSDPDVVAARDYFNVDESVLQDEFAGYAAAPPAAFDARLYNAAQSHSDYLIRIDDQNHDDQVARINGAGFQYRQAAAIVFAFARHTLHGYAGFNIDWGSGTHGTQDPPGHRHAIMSISGDYTNVGVAVVPEADPGTQVGPQVITGNFCNANTSFADHHNRFIVGTVWEDTNTNSQYDPGEGLAGVAVMPDAGAYYAVTGASGGYAIPITAGGTYRLTFSGGDLIGVFTRSATVGAASVLLDLESYAASAAGPPDSDDGGGDGGGPSGGRRSGSGGGGGGCLIGAAAQGSGRGLWIGLLLAAAVLPAGRGRSAHRQRPLQALRVEILEARDVPVLFGNDGLQVGAGGVVLYEGGDHFVEQDGVLLEFDENGHQFLQALHRGEIDLPEGEALAADQVVEQLPAHLLQKGVLPPAVERGPQL